MGIIKEVVHRKMTIEPDRRIFLNLWVSGEAYTSGFFTYKGKWAFRLSIKHDTSKGLLRRLQEAGVVITSTNESAQIREWKEVELGIKIDIGSKEPVVEREINETIAFRFTNNIGPAGILFKVEYKGKHASTGFIDFKAEDPKPLLKRFKRMGVLFYATPMVRKMMDDYNFDTSWIDWDREERKLF